MASSLSSVASVHAPPRTRASERRSIGFLTDSFTDFYQLALLQGAVQAARDRRVHLFAFAGGVPTAPVPSAPLPGARHLDALIVTAATMGYGLGVEGLASYCRALAQGPLCFLGARASGVPAVVPDNADGIEQAVRHLVRVHGRRRIAYVGGTRGNPDAEERLAAYRAALTAQGLELDPSLEAVGDFRRYPGARAMEQILDQGAPPDAVVAANDMMAFGALDALTARGLKVPTDVALIGFDDSEESHFSLPPLASVRQPLEQQGATGVKTMLEALEGRAPPPEQSLRLALMARTSCGCDITSSGLSTTRPRDFEAFENALLRNRPLVLAELSRAGQASLGRVSAKWAENLVDALVDQVRGVSAHGLLQVVRREVAQSRASGADISLWQRVLSVLRAQTIPTLGSDPRLSAAEDAFHAALQVVGLEMRDAQALRRMTVEHWMRVLRESGLALHRAGDAHQLIAALLEHLDKLGFERAYVALNETPDRSRLLLAYDKNLPSTLVDTPPTFPTTDLVPAGMLDASESRVWMVLPLALGGPAFGHVVLDYGVGEGLLWQGLAEQLSVAVELCRR